MRTEAEYWLDYVVEAARGWEEIHVEMGGNPDIGLIKSDTKRWWVNGAPCAPWVTTVDGEYRCTLIHRSTGLLTLARIPVTAVAATMDAYPDDNAMVCFVVDPALGDALIRLEQLCLKQAHTRL